MTFEEFWKESYEKEFGTSEPYYGIASYAFEKGQENCNCVYTDNSNVIQKLEKENTELKEELERNCTPEEICMKLEERIHTLEVYLEGAINFLILNGDVDNPIIQSVENILHITFNKNRWYRNDR